MAESECFSQRKKGEVKLLEIFTIYFLSFLNLCNIRAPRGERGRLFVGKDGNLIKVMRLCTVLFVVVLQLVKKHTLMEFQMVTFF